MNDQASEKDSSSAPMISPPLREAEIKRVMAGKAIYRPCEDDSTSSNGARNGSGMGGWFCGSRVMVCVLCVIMVASLWVTIDNSIAVTRLQKEVFEVSLTKDIASEALKQRVDLLETILAQIVEDVVDLREEESWDDDYYEAAPEAEVSENIAAVVHDIFNAFMYIYIYISAESPPPPSTSLLT